METDCCSHPEYQPGLRALRPVARKRPISFSLQAEMCATQTHLSALPTDKGHHIITQVSLQNKNLTRTHMLVSQTVFFLLFLTKSQFNELPFNFALKLSKKQKNKKHRFHLLFSKSRGELSKCLQVGFTSSEPKAKGHSQQNWNTSHQMHAQQWGIHEYLSAPRELLEQCGGQKATSATLSPVLTSSTKTACSYS